MMSAPVRRALDFAPLVVGVLLIVASGGIFASVALSPPRVELMTTEQYLQHQREAELWGAWSIYGLATIGLALVAFWIGRRVGRRSLR